MCCLRCRVFQPRVQAKDTVGLKVNGVWYGRPWDECWFYADCSYDVLAQTLRIEFGSDTAKVVECCCIEVGMDDDGFLCISVWDDFAEVEFGWGFESGGIASGICMSGMLRVPTLFMLYGIMGHVAAYIRDLKAHAEYFHCLRH